ncbi:MAG: glycerophosphodiester phosphodiesterase family protein [Clostridia bacterium]|nr:glycerophosphodiester phosphodiesterase family protein [Clostridia bacterium]
MMFDFSRNIKENMIPGKPMVCAHRGVSGGNIPCNTLGAFQCALYQGADMIELDVAVSRDKNLYVFHPGMEWPHAKTRRLILCTGSKNVDKMRFVNQDMTKTEYPVSRLEDVLDFLKGKCYINVDKFWTDIPRITNCIRKCGVEKQVIVKTPAKEKYSKELEACAPDFMYLPVVHHEDKVTAALEKRNINCIGAEICFDSEEDPVAGEQYVEDMHGRGKVIFANAIVYNYKDVLAAGYSDDTSIIKGPEYGWGKLIDRGYDIIQTDWCAMLKSYIYTR